MSVPVEKLNRKHPEYREFAQAWDEYSCLYRGGAAIKARASEFLVQRPKEPADVYKARILRFGYTNVLGTIAGWFISKLFKNEPEIDLAVADQTGAPSDAELNAANTAFYNAFLDNCDKRGTKFIDVFRKCFEHLLLYRRSYLLLDLEAVDPGSVRNRKEQMDLGGLDPYLSCFEPCQIINWSDDKFGVLDWIVLYAKEVKQSFLGDNMVVERWTHFDRTSFTVYERTYPEGSSNVPDDAAVVAGPAPHAFADQNRVPIYRLEVPEGLWLADRLSLPARDFLNTENGLAWALMMGNLAIPVITGKIEDDSLTMSEVGAWLLPEGCTFSYAEQTGAAFKITIDRLEQIREEIYRAAYLMDQGRSTAATPASSSGISKQADKEPSKDVLNCYGDIIRAAMKRVLEDVAAVREISDVAVDVRGYSFESDNPVAELDLIERGIALNVPSDTLDKYLLKKASRLLLCDAGQNLNTKVAADIDAAPTREDRELARVEAEQSAMAAGLESSVSSQAA